MSDDKKERIKKKLTDTRERLFTVARQLDADDWTQPVYGHGDEEWSAADVLRHLSWSESGMLRLMQGIRQGGDGVPEDFDRNRYNATGVRKLKDKVPAEIMALMEENRQQLLAFIDSLEEEDWEKEGRHASLRTLSIEQVLHVMSAHEQQHLDDLRQAFDNT